MIIFVGPCGKAFRLSDSAATTTKISWSGRLFAFAGLAVDTTAHAGLRGIAFVACTANTISDLDDAGHFYPVPKEVAAGAEDPPAIPSVSHRGGGIAAEFKKLALSSKAKIERLGRGLKTKSNRNPRPRTLSNHGASPSESPAALSTSNTPKDSTADELTCLTPDNTVESEGHVVPHLADVCGLEGRPINSLRGSEAADIGSKLHSVRP